MKSVVYPNPRESLAAGAHQPLDLDPALAGSCDDKTLTAAAFALDLTGTLHIVGAALSDHGGDV